MQRNESEKPDYDQCLKILQNRNSEKIPKDELNLGLAELHQLKEDLKAYLVVLAESKNTNEKKMWKNLLKDVQTEINRCPVESIYKDFRREVDSVKDKEKCMQYYTLCMVELRKLKAKVNKYLRYLETANSSVSLGTVSYNKFLNLKSEIKSAIKVIEEDANHELRRVRSIIVREYNKHPYSKLNPVTQQDHDAFIVDLNKVLSEDLDLKSCYSLSFLSHLNNTNFKIEEINGHYAEVLTLSRFDPLVDDIKTIEGCRNQVVQKCPQYMAHQTVFQRIDKEYSPAGVIVYMSFSEYFPSGDLDKVATQFRAQAEHGNNTELLLNAFIYLRKTIELVDGLNENNIYFPDIKLSNLYLTTNSSNEKIVKFSDYKSLIELNGPYSMFDIERKIQLTRVFLPEEFRRKVSDIEMQKAHKLTVDDLDRVQCYLIAMSFSWFCVGKCERPEDKFYMPNFRKEVFSDTKAGQEMKKCIWGLMDVDVNVRSKAKKLIARLSKDNFAEFRIFLNKGLKPESSHSLLAMAMTNSAGSGSQRVVSLARGSSAPSLASSASSPNLAQLATGSQSASVLDRGSSLEEIKKKSPKGSKRTLKGK